MRNQTRALIGVILIGYIIWAWVSMPPAYAAHQAHSLFVVDKISCPPANLSTEPRALRQTVVGMGSPRPQPPGQSYSVEQWRSLVARYFPPEAVEEALLCITLESSGNPYCVTGDYVGLWQMDSGYGTYEQRTNPEWSTAVAYACWKANGWRNWPPMKKRGY